MKDFSPESLNLVLKFLYCNKMSSLTLEDALDLLKLAHFFQIGSIVHQCEQFIIHSNIDAVSVCYIWNAAKEIKAEHVFEICRNYFIENFEACIQHPGFLHLDKELLKLSLDPGCINCHESIIIKALEKWGAATSLPFYDMLPPQVLFNSRIKNSLFNPKKNSLLEILVNS
jgi:hypothetical protein